MVVPRTPRFAAIRFIPADPYYLCVLSRFYYYVWRADDSPVELAASTGSNRSASNIIPKSKSSVNTPLLGRIDLWLV